MSQKLLSIIVPFYNVYPYVECLTQSIFSQLTKDIEIIFVEDCSTDGTRELVESICKDNESFMDITCIYHPKNRGLSLARNSGIKAAKGEYIMFLDSDDLIKQGALKNILAQIKKGKEDIIFYSFAEFGDMDECPGNINNISLKYPNQIHLQKHAFSTVGLDEKENFFIDYLNNKKFYAWMFVAKRSLYADNKIIFPEKKYFEDIYMTPKLIWSANSYYYFDKPVIYYRQRSSSIKGKINIDNRMDLYRSFDSLIDYFSLQHASERIVDVLRYHSITYKRMAFWDLYKNDPSSVDMDFFRQDLKNLKQKYPKLLSGYIKLAKKNIGLYMALLDYLFFQCVDCFMVYQKFKGKILLSLCRIIKMEKRCEYYQDEYGNIV